MRFLCAYRHRKEGEIVLKVEVRESKSDIMEFAINEVIRDISIKYGIPTDIIERDVNDEGEEIKKVGILYVRPKKSYSPSKLCGL